MPLNNALRKYPALFSVIPLIGGILISSSFKSEVVKFGSEVYVAISASILILILVFYGLRTKSKLFLNGYFLLVFALGFLTFQYRHFCELSNNVENFLSNDRQMKTVIKGTVTENPEIKPESIRILMDEIVIDSKNAEGMVLATVYKNKFKESELKDITYGNIIEIEGILERLPHRRNPGEFDYGAYLKMHDIDAVFYAYGFDKLINTGTTQQNFYRSNIVNPVRNYTISAIEKYIGGDGGEYLKGLMLGERSNISKQIKEDFINAGVAHIIAVSGLNVAYVLVIIWAMLVIVPIRQSYKLLITILLLIFYMNLTGNTPSIIRATIMASVFLLSQAVERRTNIYNVISFSALVILLIDARQLFDAGFILSYSAILSIVIIYPKINEWLNKMKWYSDLDTQKLKGKLVKLLSGLFFGTLAAQLGTLPLTALMFKKISLVSMIANLFAIPLSNISLAIGFIFVIASLMSSWLAAVFSSANALLIFLQLKAISFCANLDYAFIETYFVNGYFLFAYYLVLALFYSLSKKNLVPRLIIIAFISIDFLVYSGIANRTEKAELTYIDVGNSSSTLIRMPGGTNILVGTGSSTRNYFSSERNIIPYLKTKGVESIDLMVINNLNINEYSNLVFLVNNFNVKKIIIPVHYQPIFAGSKIFRFVPVVYINEPVVLNKQGNFRLYLYYSSKLKGESMMTELVYGEQSFIFNDSYDIESDIYNSVVLPEENALMVLKASGSGSFDYNSAEFIAKAEPEFVVISSSLRGRQKAASEIFARAIDESGYTVLNTGIEGAIIFETDGYETKRDIWK